MDRKRVERRGSRRRRRGRRAGLRRNLAARIAVSPASRRPRRHRLRPPLQRRRQPDAVVHPAPALGSRAEAGTGQGVSRGLARGLRGGEPRLRGRRRRRARVRSGSDGVLPRLPPLSRAEVRAGALPGRPARPLRPHPVGERRRLERAPGRHAPGRARRPARERPRRLSHRALAEAVRGSGRGHHGRRDEDGGAPDLRRPGRAGRAGDRRGGSRPPRRASAGPAGAPGRTRRSHRSLEEHPARLPRVRAPAREPPGASRARRDACAARSLSPGHPRVRRVPGGDRARGGRRQRARRRASDRPPDRGRLPAVGGRVHGVRRAVREPDLRRAQPRREGGPAAERPRRRARALRERGRRGGARPVGARREPVRRRGAGGRASPGARAAGGRADGAALGAARARSRRTTSPGGPTGSLPR